MNLNSTYDLTSSTSSSIEAWSPNPVNITAHPFLARVRRIPKPIPLVDPVTKATFPDKSISKSNITSHIEKIGQAATGAKYGCSCSYEVAETGTRISDCDGTLLIHVPYTTPQENIEF